VPRAPSHTPGVTLCVEMSDHFPRLGLWLANAPRQRTLLLLLCYYGLMRQSSSLLAPRLFDLCARSLQVVGSPCCDEDLPDVISVNLSRCAWIPTPAAPEVLLPVTSLRTSAFPTFRLGRRFTSIPYSDSVRSSFTRLQSFTYVQAHRFACHPVAPTAEGSCPLGFGGLSKIFILGLSPTPLGPRAQGSYGVSIRTPYGSLPSHTPDMLAVRIGQLTAEDFHLIRFTALSAVSANVELSRRPMSHIPLER